MMHSACRSESAVARTLAIKSKNENILTKLLFLVREVIAVDIGGV